MKNLYIVIFVFICTVIVLSGCTNTKSNNNNNKNDRMTSGPKVVFPKSSKRLFRNNRLTTKSSVVGASSAPSTIKSVTTEASTKTSIETTPQRTRDSSALKPMVVKLKTKEDLLAFFNGAVKL